MGCFLLGDEEEGSNEVRESEREIQEAIEGLRYVDQTQAYTSNHAFTERAPKRSSLRFTPPSSLLFINRAQPCKSDAKPPDLGVDTLTVWTPIAASSFALAAAFDAKTLRKARALCTGYDLFIFLSCLFPILFLMINQALGQNCIDEKGNYTTNSTYQTNLNRLLSSLPSNENGNGYGFYNASYHLNSSNEHIYAIGLCRGDLTVGDCRTCLSNSVYDLLQRCPNQKEAFGSYEKCMLRYSNRSIYGVMETEPSSTYYNIYNVSSDCLVGAFARISYFYGKEGGGVNNPSCYFRFDLYPFYDPTTVKQMPSPPPIHSPPPSTNTTNTSQEMGSSRSLLIFIFPILFNLIPPTTSQNDGICTDNPYYCWKCSDTGTYTPGDMYQENLNSLLSSFTTNTEISSGFYNFSKGQDPNKVNAIALCRGDLSQDACHTHLNDSINALLQNCSTHPKEAIMWTEHCMVRYSNNLIFGIEKEDPIKFVPSPNPAKDSAQFNLVLNPLLSTLIEKAASGDSTKKFAAGHATVPGGETIYALVQCTPDIKQLNCSHCLTEAVSDIPGCCGGMQGGRVLKPSCNLRYEVSLFYEPTSDLPVNIPPPGPAAPAPKGAAKKSNTKVIIIVVVVVLVAFVTILSSICVYLRVKKRGVKLEVEDQDNSDEISLVESLKYDYDTIRSATDDFSDANELGRGGFGAVYKYVHHGNLSVKTDVFSFGVLILEIVSGQKIGRFRYGENEESLLSYVSNSTIKLVDSLFFPLQGKVAWRNWSESTISNVIDPMLTTSSRIETTRCIHIGLLCVQENVVSRPTSASVVSMLNSHSVTLAVPSKPAFHAQNDSGLILAESDESESRTPSVSVEFSYRKMGYSRPLLFFILPIILGLHAPAIADDVDNGVCTTTADYCWSCSGTNETFNNGSNYERNLHTVLSSFSSNKTEINSAFYNSSLGQGPEKVNAMALCRGDVPLNDCHTCFNESISILRQNCTNQKQATIWAQRCTVHYSNVSIFGVAEDDPVKFVPGPTNAPNAEQFKQVLNPLVVNLSGTAAAGDSMKKFAAGHALVPATNQTIYAIVQCTPDLDRQNCSECLDEAISDIPQCCEGKEGGRVLRPSCNLRFESNLFYDAASDSLVNLPGKQGTSFICLAINLIFRENFRNEPEL
ncbi:hypothetical protein DVH24_011668 [Malus domestica]|uniref:Gnk2-homologous domain-containing protein n=1 Tax=Malus domestica TaxID=3750 RepID=A0A498JZ90_MALDO|nr:hypothetical protein DVH24_011668 [Malus domestica]